MLVLLGSLLPPWCRLLFLLAIMLLSVKTGMPSSANFINVTCGSVSTFLIICNLLATDNAFCFIPTFDAIFLTVG
jgi:hypothetical protein